MNASELNEFNSIRQWLNSDKNFTRGFLLLSAYSDNRDVVSSLQRFPENSLLYSEIKSRYDSLKLLYDNTTEEEPKKAAKILHQNKVIEAAIKQATEVDPIKAYAVHSEKHRKKLQIQDELKDHFKKRSLWHSELQALTYHLDNSPKKNLSPEEEAKAFETSKLLLDLQDKIDTALNHLDYYGIHGNFPQTAYKQRVKKVVALSQPEAILKLKNSVAPQHSKLKSKISKAKESLPALIGKPKDKMMRQLAKWQTQFDELDKEKVNLENVIHGK